MQDAWLLTLADMEERRKLGLERYGEPVSHERRGVDWLRHAYEEALDLAVYLRAEIESREQSTGAGQAP